MKIAWGSAIVAMILIFLGFSCYNHLIDKTEEPRLELIRWQDDWRFFSSISPHHHPHSTLHNPRLLQGIQVCQTVSCCNNHKETKKLTFYDTRYHPIDAKTAKRNYEAASNLDYDYEYEENNRDVIIIEEGDDAQQR